MGPEGSGLAPLEIASGLVFGVEENDARVAAPPLRPLEAVEAAVLPALRRPPCLVSFSGGRDSSCVLALATHVARREGLDLPIPATLRFPGLEEADENAWQDRVTSELGLEDWLKLEPGDDLDAVGPIAAHVLCQHGLLWPFNAYVHVPLLQAARGGSLLTGVGGDELFALMTPDRLHAVLGRRAKPVPRDVLRLGLVGAPPTIRRAVLRRRCPLRLPWLRPEAQRALERAWAAEAASEPRRLAARASWWARRRSLRAAARSFAILAAAEDVAIAHPLAEPALAGAILRDPDVAHAGRAGRLRAVFADLLPDDVYMRRSKASFNRAFFGPHARALAASWEGEGVDPALVDLRALAEAWREESPDGRTYTLLQTVWVARSSRDATKAAMPAATS